MKSNNKRTISLALAVTVLLSMIAVPVTSDAATTGVNLAMLAGNTYTASTSDPARLPGLAFDGNRTGSNSRWAENATTGSKQPNQWLQVSFATPQTVTSAVIYFETMTPVNGNGAITGTVQLQTSADGAANWTTISQKSTTDGTLTAAEVSSKTVTLTFTAATTQYIRLFWPEGHYYLSVYEFEMYYDDSPPPIGDGTNLARLSGNTYSASSSDGARPVGLAFDGDSTGSRWAEGVSNVAGQWIQVTFAARQAVSSAVIYFEALSKGTDASTLNGTVDLQYSPDGVTWKTIQEQVFSGNADKTVTFSFAPMYITYIRLYFPDSNGQFYLSIYEFELYWNGVAPAGGDIAQLLASYNQYQPYYTDTALSQYKMSAVNAYKNAIAAALSIIQAATPPAQADIDSARNTLVSAVNALEKNRIIFPDALAAKPAEDWNELFNNLQNPNSDDWRAGDGMHSVPLNGMRAIGGGGADTPTAWMFSDSYVSSFKDLSQSLLLNPLQMPNNVFANFSGVSADKSKLSFVFGQGGNKALLRTGPGSEGGISNVVPEAYWVQDGIVIGNNLYVTFDHEDNATLTTNHISMAKFPILNGTRVDWASYTWLGYKDSLFNSNTTFVTGILDNSALSGVPAAKADGYVYCYGQTVPGTAQRRVVVARTTKADFENPENWQFWTAAGWQTGAAANLANCAPITPGNLLVSSSSSVTYINSGIYNGKYLMTYTDGALGEKIGYMLADNPWGPFANPTVCFVAPQMEQYQNELYQVDNPNAWYVTYNPCAHPQLSPAGKLLISYDCFVWNSNKPTNTNWHSTETNEFYRERFFMLDLNNMAAVTPQACNTCVSRGKPVVASSGANPSAVNDGSDFTKWQSSGAEANKTLTIDLGAPMEIGRSIVKHGGIAIVNNSDTAARNFLNTKIFQIQYSNDNSSWTTAVNHPYNASFENDENFTPAIARYWRLNIQQPTQGAMDKATVYEFQLYSPDHSITVSNPFAVSVSLSQNIAIYGTSVSFTITQTGVTAPYDAVALYDTGGNLLQTLTPAWTGMYSFSMPDKDVIIKLSAAESGIISAQVINQQPAYAMNKDMIHVLVTAVPSVTRVALYDTDGRRVPISTQTVTTAANGNLLWDLRFRLDGAGDHVLTAHGGEKAFITSTWAVIVTVAG